MEWAFGLIFRDIYYQNKIFWKISRVKTILFYLFLGKISEERLPASFILQQRRSTRQNPRIRTATMDPIMIPIVSSLVSRYGGVTGSSDEPDCQKAAIPDKGSYKNDVTQF